MYVYTYVYVCVCVCILIVLFRVVMMCELTNNDNEAEFMTSLVDIPLYIHNINKRTKTKMTFHLTYDLPGALTNSHIFVYTA